MLDELLSQPMPDNSPDPAGWVQPPSKRLLGELVVTLMMMGAVWDEDNDLCMPTSEGEPGDALILFSEPYMHDRHTLNQANCRILLRLPPLEETP